MFAILSVSCAAGQDIWRKYEAGGQHRAYAIGNKGAAGSAWNYPTAEKAMQAAISSCNREGEIGCHVTHLNGSPYDETSSKKSETTQPEPVLVPKPAPTTKAISVPEPVPAPKVVLATEPVSIPKAVPAPEPSTTLVSSGTGFFVSEKGQIITNAQVVDGCTFTRILYQNNAYDVSLIKADPHNDLALLQSTITDHKTALLEIERIPRLDEPVITFGYPLSSALSSEPEVIDGILSSTTGLNDDSRYFQISAPVQPGNNGWPLLDQFGRVIGVVTAKSGDNRSIENAAVKALVIKAFLDSNIVAMKKPRQAPRQMSLPDIVEAAKLYTVQIGCFK